MNHNGVLFSGRLLEGLKRGHAAQPLLSEPHIFKTLLWSAPSYRDMARVALVARLETYQHERTQYVKAA